MSNGKNWTPGPWTPQWNGYFWDIKPDFSIHDVLSINSAWDDDPDSVGTEEGNAYLVAAAPDLYEALFNLCKFCDEAAADAFDDGETEAARLALAKARGETNQQEND